jgi:glycogen operon protein
MAEWNAQFRDDVRKFWRGDSGLRGALAARLQGSADLFDHDHRKPWAALNFIAAHDGFTLQDLVSYNHKHNEANGEDNRDGSDDNGSSNCGVEGPSDDAAVTEQRDRLRCAMLSTLLLSHGTPMLLGGDEFGRTQGGNNNAYCQDSELSWFDWAQARSSAGRAMQEFVARLLRLRAEFQSLRVNYFQHGRLEPLSGVRDIEWFDENGDTMRQEDWHEADARLLSVRRVVRRRDGRAEASLLLINNQTHARSFQLPQPQFAWWLKLDSADMHRTDHEVDQSAIRVAPQSVQLLAAIVEAPSPDGLLHAASDTAAQPTPAPLPDSTSL